MDQKSSASSEQIAAAEPMVNLIGFRLSTATVLFHSAVADRLGVNATDVKCYSILRYTGALSAGELAEHTGLTTGAITGVIDRLEKAGLVRRAHDPHDRRRVVVELIDDPERTRAIDQLYEPMGRSIFELISSYSPAELQTISDFLSKATAVLEQETVNLRQGR